MTNIGETTIVSIPSLIQSQRRGEYSTRRYHLPPCHQYQISEHYYPPYLRNSRNSVDPIRHPNQPFSSPSSVSSSSSSRSYEIENEEQEADGVRRQEEQYSLQSISFESENVANISVESAVSAESAVSVDGDFDVRIDIIQLSSSKSPDTNSVASAMNTNMVASAPPLSDYESECEPETIELKTEKQEEVCICVICYEPFESVEIVQGRKYSVEELEDIEGKEKVSDFCQTCKYNVHHRCIDDYRLNKFTDSLKNINSRESRGQAIPRSLSMTCLMCSKEVEKIHISRDGDIKIVKSQRNDQRGQQEPRQPEPRQQEQQEPQQQQQQQQQIQEIWENRMQRRRQRRARLYFLKDKACIICFCLLVVVSMLVLIFRMI